ncbi:FAD-dependent oxidoreductase [Nodosilinea sp. LEGE 06152]|uniref:NAD(P)/FAD-dependent oxidoreductase n=1 Tax=Nodosilinea sp. LEGE 06152 TaxID=2777966 RepID=UPI0018817CE1|nr:FAD-dependent oxidoreductase [Nodosilinea sp. LEGE 06152]MBE9158270.1 FAD-dependent oxidoreductase [Nodosilinea sp. LEGE 06152]
MEDVVVIGAGLSGLTAARALHQAGYRVVVVDKSRGLGGRLATRRIGNTAIDHGCRYLRPFEGLNNAFNHYPNLGLMPDLVAGDVLQLWQPESFELGADGLLNPTATAALYVAPQGMSSIAKALAPGLTIHRQWRATAVTPLPQGWRVEGEVLGAASQSLPEAFIARALVVAIPAPQAAALMHRAAQDSEGVKVLLHQLLSVNFEAVITVMAGYKPGEAARLTEQTGSGGWMVTSDTHPTLRWIALDSSKRTDPQEPVVVIHSSPAFAAGALEQADLEPIGQALFAEAASLGAWMLFPQWVQVHRWRYGFVRQPLGASILSSPLLPNLVGCGDWCNGGNVEGAIASGQAAAAALTKTLG